MILLKNAVFIDEVRLSVKDCHILVEEGPAGNISFPGNIAEYENDRGISILDCHHQPVLHSFVNAHHHAYSALSPGMPLPIKSPVNFKEKLERVWWKLDKALDREMIQYSAYVTAIACAKAACTFIVDHHSSPYAVEGSLDIIAKAFEEVGVAHLLCYEISGRDGQAIAEKGLAETENYLQHQQGLVGLHASFTLDQPTLVKAAELAGKYSTGIHIHTAEDPVDQEITLQQQGCSVAERLQRSGLLESPKTILAHCLHLSKTEREIIRRSPVSVVQNCESNLNNKVGYFTAKGLGDRIMLGTDGMHSDMIRSMQAAYFTGLNQEEMNPGIALNRLRRAHRYLNSNGFTGDGPNNLVVLEYDNPTNYTGENLQGHLVYGLSGRQVRHVIAGGRFIVKDKVIQLVNEQEILRTSRQLALRLWDKLR